MTDQPRPASQPPPPGVVRWTFSRGSKVRLIGDPQSGHTIVEYDTPPIEAEAAAPTPAEPLDEYERSTVYVALANLNHDGRRWSWWNGTDWQQGDSGDFGDAFIAEYNRLAAARPEAAQEDERP